MVDEEKMKNWKWYEWLAFGVGGSLPYIAIYVVLRLTGVIV